MCCLSKSASASGSPSLLAMTELETLGERGVADSHTRSSHAAPTAIATGVGEVTIFPRRSAAESAVSAELSGRFCQSSVAPAFLRLRSLIQPRTAAFLIRETRAC